MWWYKSFLPQDKRYCEISLDKYNPNHIKCIVCTLICDAFEISDYVQAFCCPIKVG